VYPSVPTVDLTDNTAATLASITLSLLSQELDVPLFYIMWTRTQATNELCTWWIPNHFVPLLIEKVGKIF